ncbi:sialate O-acetylesterase [Ilyomonas limi]|uniref:Sialate O-acetylesterase n=1 Tax=Ilyomonas limi TaxID=2575867 RepID=A0A4U3KS47_9BACT|nr:sialate O-acetylesterase [Ilyomonas limi]TKK64284.1 sialate O-acetylesterase [Ilyomonas limi]
MKKPILFTTLLCIAASSLANIRLPNVINNNMVLQQQSSVTLWGWAEPGEKVIITTSWDNKMDSVTTTRDAKWQVPITTPKAGGPYTITLKGNNSITLDNVLIGEVWVCSGQSNMEMSGSWGLQDIKNELPTAYNTNIRFFHIPKTTAEFPQDNCAGEWEICDSNTLKTFSAAGYFFGKQLNQKLNVPIGLIESAWGGTPAEVWTPDSIVTSNDTLQAAASKLQPSNGWPYKPGYTYNAMIYPITPYNIAGAIWYQGESNTGTANTYTQLFTDMITSWCKAWNKDLPFYYVQIAPFKYGTPYIGALLQEAQQQAMQLDNTGMVVITDLVADTNDIHPTNKHDVGIRLANWALAETYNQQGIAYRSPMYKNMAVDKDKAIITFDNVLNGLAIKGGSAKELYISGSDHIFFPANATVKNGQLVVWSKFVKQPVAVRYGFGNTAEGNIFSTEGLPVAPFRTDDWAVNTQ